MLTDAQIAILCDIGQGSSFDGKKMDEVLSPRRPFQDYAKGVRKC
jgi:hypothetical protein